MVLVGFHFECFLGWLSRCVCGNGGVEVEVDVEASGCCSYSAKFDLVAVR